MQSTYTGHISPPEWRWVIFLSIGFALLSFVPFLWIAIINTQDTTWQFMGVLHQYENGAVWLSKIQQGRGIDWLIHFQHTPESHDGAMLQLLYILLGKVAGVLSLSTVVVFHVGRIIAMLLMYIALYLLGATIWVKIRARKIFFILVSLSSGLSVVFLPLTRQVNYPDLFFPQIYPFYSSLVNIHFPLTIALLALMVSIIITVFRPGVTLMPDVNNQGLIVFFASLGLMIIYPESLLPLTIALVLYVAIHWQQQKSIPIRELRWLLWIVAPSLPILAYYVSLIRLNGAVEIWISQQGVAPVSIFDLGVGLGIPLMIALPGIIRAIRHIEADDDRFMVLWLFALILLMYLPIGFNMVFVIGLMIPVVYFATRALEDFWFQYIRRKWRYHLFVALLPILVLSNFYVLFIPISPIVNGNPLGTRGMVLEPEYRLAFDWLSRRTTSRDVILASPEVSLWIPYWVNARPFYGHLDETLNGWQKKRAVQNWYNTSTETLCQDVLYGEYTTTRPYRVDYVIYGVRERALGEANCLSLLIPQISFGDVVIYSVPTRIPPEINIGS